MKNASLKKTLGILFTLLGTAAILIGGYALMVGGMNMGMVSISIAGAFVPLVIGFIFFGYGMSLIRSTADNA